MHLIELSACTKFINAQFMTSVANQYRSTMSETVFELIGYLRTVDPNPNQQSCICLIEILVLLPMKNLKTLNPSLCPKLSLSCERSPLLQKKKNANEFPGDFALRIKVPSI